MEHKPIGGRECH